MWDFGSVTNPTGETNIVSFGINLMLQTTSLAILETASDGRMTPLRLWKWCMSGDSYRGYALEKNIDYNGPDLEQFPSAFPGFPYEFENDELLEMADLSDDQLLERFIYRGRFWVWMRPDR